MHCLHCRYFESNRAVDRDALDIYEAEGECRCHCPRLGVMVTEPDGEQRRYFGQWPRVLACDWCGEYEAVNSESTPPQTGRRLTACP